MLRTSALSLLLILAGPLSFVTMPAYADSIPVASYAIHGSLSLTGNNVCGGPCVETLTYSFRLDYFAVTLASYIYGPPDDPCIWDIIGGLTSTCYQAKGVGPVLVSASGPLGSFGNYGAVCCGMEEGFYTPFTNSPNYGSADEIDLHIGNVVGNPALGIPVPYAEGAQLWKCGTATCNYDFQSTENWQPWGPAEFTATRLAVPEPSTLALVAPGMLAIGLFMAASRKMF